MHASNATKKDAIAKMRTAKDFEREEDERNAIKEKEEAEMEVE